MTAHELATPTTETGVAFSLNMPETVKTPDGLPDAFTIDLSAVPDENPRGVPVQVLERARIAQNIGKSWPGLTSSFHTKASPEVHYRFMRRVFGGAFSELILKTVSMEHIGTIALPFPDAPRAITIVSRGLSRSTGEHITSFHFCIPRRPRQAIS